MYSLIHDFFSQPLTKFEVGEIYKKNAETIWMKRENACWNRGIWMVGDHRMGKKN